MTSEEMRFNMRCRVCKNIVPYMADEANGDYYKTVRKATKGRKHFTFKDYCGYCCAESLFYVTYEKFNQEAKPWSMH